MTICLSGRPRLLGNTRTGASVNRAEGEQTIRAALEPEAKLLWSGVASRRRYWSVARNRLTLFAVLAVYAGAIFWMRDRYLSASLSIEIPILLFIGMATYVRTNAFGLSETEAIKITRAAPFFTNQIRRVRVVTNSGFPVPIKLNGAAAIMFGGRFAEAAPDGTRRVEKVSFEGLEDAAQVYKIAVEAQLRLMASTRRRSA
ncbi:MAG: hypothetical protein ACYDC3_15280 [Candidatus Binataceae bacterium]